MIYSSNNNTQLLAINIVNMVATAALNQVVSLEEISRLNHVIFDKEIYKGRVAYLKTTEMHGKVIIFPSGKLISIGTRSLKQAQKDLETTASYLHSSGLIHSVKVTAKIRNIVAVMTFENIPALEEIVNTQGAMYEPEQFPGAILKIEETNATYLIFQSGKIVISGTNSIEQLKKSEKKIIQLLDKMIYA